MNERGHEMVHKGGSNLRRVLQEFKAILDAIPQSVFLLSHDLKMLWFNRRSTSEIDKIYAKLTGCTCYGFLYKLSAPCEGCPAIKSINTGRPEIANIATPDGTCRNIIAIPVKDNSRVVKNIITVADCGTNKTGFHNPIETSNIESLDKRSVMTGYKIRNPINPVLNCAQVLLDEYNRECSNSEIANQLIKKNDRIASIIKSLLFYARINTKKRIPVPIHEPLSDSLHLTVGPIRKEGINLKIIISPGLPKIIAHSQEIQLVFLNIINNARYALNKKYNTPDEDKILYILCVRRRVDNSTYLQTTFYDRGTGIPADIIDKVKTPLFTTKPLNTGTGLGLSICQRIINKYGGQLVIESIREEFTRVTVLIPAGERK